MCHDERVTVDSHVTIVRPAYEALVEYLGCWALSSEDQFESMAKGSTGLIIAGRLPRRSTLSCHTVPRRAASC